MKVTAEQRRDSRIAGKAKERRAKYSGDCPQRKVSQDIDLLIQYGQKEVLTKLREKMLN